jgi:rRNA-processing protein FCF1
MKENSPSERIWLDTNFVVQMGKPGTHLAEQLHQLLGTEFEVGLTPAVQHELLERISDKATQRPTGLGLQIIGVKPEKLAQKKGLLADDELVGLAREGATVATLDAGLRKRIKAFGGRLLYLKKGNRIALD